MVFRFVHTADIHLDSPLKSLALRNPALAELVSGATRNTFERIIDFCLDERVDALVIAGDLYDGDLRSMKTAAFLGRQMRRLNNAGIRVFIVRGNHDAEAQITRHLDLPPNVHVFDGHGGSEELTEFDIAVHGVSFPKRHAPESLLAKYRPPTPGFFNVGIMHTSLAGHGHHDVYAPCSVNDLINHGYDYWALGHIHKRKVHCHAPFVVMPGIPQGRDIGEAGPGSVTMVEISQAGITLDERRVAIAEFHSTAVNLNEIEDWQEALSALRQALQDVHHTVTADHAICRIVLCGRSPLGWRLRRDSDLLRTEAQDAAEHVGGIWIEQIDNKVMPPTSSLTSADPVEELAVLMQEAGEDSAFRNEAASHLNDMVRALPGELRDSFGSAQDGCETILDELLARGIEDVVATLKCRHPGSQNS